MEVACTEYKHPLKLYKGIEENIRDRAVAADTYLCIDTLDKIASLIKVVMTENSLIMHILKAY